MPMDVKKFSHTELIKRCAQEPADQNAWMEFYHRFDDHIRLMLARECRLKHLNAHNLLDDLVQNVYLRLVQNNCKALRNYKAGNDDSIYSYLAVIAHSVVCTYLAREGAQKRRHIEESLDEPVSGSLENGDLPRIETIPNHEPEPDANLIRESKRLEVESLLDKILKGNDKGRDKLIFRWYFYEGFSAAQIAGQCGIALSEKRISNIISDTKKRLAKTLRGGQKPEAL